MRERPDCDDPLPSFELSDEQEREHARRNALQGEMLRRLLRQQQHQAHIERTLIGARDK